MRRHVATVVVMAFLATVAANLLTAGLGGSAAALVESPPSSIHAYDVSPNYPLTGSVETSLMRAASRTPARERQASLGPEPSRIDPVVAAETASAGTELVPYEAYPPDAIAPRGFVGGSFPDTLQPDTVVSRYGGEGGFFASPEGSPFSARGLPPEVEAGGENLYRVAKPIDVNGGIAAYWQGGGGGIQWEFQNSVDWLLRNGFLKSYP